MSDRDAWRRRHFRRKLALMRELGRHAEAVLQGMHWEHGNPDIIAARARGVLLPEDTWRPVEEAYTMEG